MFLLASAAAASKIPAFFVLLSVARDLKLGEALGWVGGQ